MVLVVPHVVVLTVFLSEDNSGDEADTELDLLRPRQHLIVQQNRQDAVPGGGQESGEVKTTEPNTEHSTIHG